MARRAGRHASANGTAARAARASPPGCGGQRPSLTLAGETSRAFSRSKLD